MRFKSLEGFAFGYFQELKCDQVQDQRVWEWFLGSECCVQAEVVPESAMTTVEQLHCGARIMIFLV